MNACDQDDIPLIQALAVLLVIKITCTAPPSVQPEAQRSFKLQALVVHVNSDRKPTVHF